MLKERKDVAERLKWNTSDIFATEQEWGTLFANCETRLDFSETTVPQQKRPDSSEPGRYDEN